MVQPEDSPLALNLRTRVIAANLGLRLVRGTSTLGSVLALRQVAWDELTISPKPLSCRPHVTGGLV